MNLEKLNELDAKKINKQNSLVTDLENTKNRLEKLQAELPAMVLNTNDKTVDNMVSEMRELEIKEKALETTLQAMDKGNPYYTDEDVSAGFREYISVYDKQFGKLRSEYNKLLDSLFAKYREIVSLRRDALSVRSAYASHLSSSANTESWKNQMVLATLGRNRDDRENIDFRCFYSDVKQMYDDNSAINGNYGR